MNTWRILHGDVRERLRDLPDGSVQTCVTSPPYWGLRDYGTAKWNGGDSSCQHVGAIARTVSGGAGKQYTNAGSNRVYSGDCDCGARRIDNQIGLEPTPDAFVASLVEVFREVRRVLAEDGTAWVNLGDSYAAGKAGRTDYGTGDPTSTLGPNRDGLPNNTRPGAVIQRSAPDGFKPKDLVGIPWRVAFALQADGWYLRSDIIWSKPNPMPESVTDRPTKAHEYIFLLSKSARYYYDAFAIAEGQASNGFGGFSNKATLKSVRLDAGHKPSLVNAENDGQRNKRSVWHIATQPYPEAHFATFPEALIEPCILAGTSEKGCCPKCYKGWVRQTEYGEVISTGGSNKGIRVAGNPTTDFKGGAYNCGEFIQRAKHMTGWQPSCDCQAGDPIPCTVLDPFNGSGTTGAVAIRHQRNYIGIELNAEYVRLSEARIGAVAPLFAQQSHAEPEPEEISLFTMEETA